MMLHPSDVTPLHVVSPLIKSSTLTSLAGCKVLLKLENCQPSGSFKLRGIGYLCEKEKLAGKQGVVCSSGGNAGLAAAYACRQLKMNCRIFVPGSTPHFVVSRLEKEGADVQASGQRWDQANQAALNYLSTEANSAFIHPYDHPDIWLGHSTMVHEIKDQMRGKKPGCIVASVGGGGLLAGIIRGLDDVGWSDVPVIAMETEGADSFSACMKAGRIVEIPDITSIAKSLGSRTICQQLFDYAKTHNVISHVLTDTQALSACIRFADDHRVLVEPACGVSLAAVYSDAIHQLQSKGVLPSDLDHIVIIVCGGSIVTMETLNNYISMLQ